MHWLEIEMLLNESGDNASILQTQPRSHSRGLPRTETLSTSIRNSIGR